MHLHKRLWGGRRWWWQSPGNTSLLANASLINTLLSELFSSSYLEFMAYFFSFKSYTVGKHHYGLAYYNFFILFSGWMQGYSTRHSWFSIHWLPREWLYTARWGILSSTVCCYSDATTHQEQKRPKTEHTGNQTVQKNERRKRWRRREHVKCQSTCFIRGVYVSPTKGVSHKE